MAHDILKRTLVYDPNLRAPIETILAHAYFDELRSNSPPKRSNGAPIPPLNYWAIEQVNFELLKSVLLFSEDTVRPFNSNSVETSCN